MNKDEFVIALTELGINVTDDQLTKLDTYYKKVISFNEHTNLTRITNEKEFYLKHFYDSLTLIKAIDLNEQTLLDVGTGAGFPGLVLKIIFPKLKVTLLDSLNKRIIFLNEVISSLKLKDVVTVHSRAEDYAVKERESFDIVTSRAVANLSLLSELCLPLVKVGGYFIPMKADSKEEIKTGSSAIDKLGGIIDKIDDFNLPNEAGKRTIIKVKKVKQSNVKYPRKFGEIKRKPL